LDPLQRSTLKNLNKAGVSLEVSFLEIMELDRSQGAAGRLEAVRKWRSVLLFVGVWTLVGLAFSALYYASALSEPYPASISSALRLNLSRFYLWAILSPLLLLFTYRYPVELRPFNWRNLLIQIPVVLLASSIHAAMHLMLGWYLEPSFKFISASLAGIYHALFLQSVYVNILLGSLIVITAHALLYYRNYRAAEVQRSHLRAELAQAQLQALKMQLHPHFLFNTLHSISSLVLEDPGRANRMIAQLGDFLRMTLESSQEQTVSLRQEIEFLQRYLEIEQVRFEDRLKVVFDIEPTALSSEVPHLILQPIVENAIRHGIAQRAAPGLIRISGAQLNGLLRVEVRDNGPGIKGGEDPTNNQGVGLNNVRARLKQLYGRKFSLEMANHPEGGLIVTLELPLNSVC
jgi:sensor histidine kinase YesM